MAAAGKVGILVEFNFEEPEVSGTDKTEGTSRQI